LQCYDVWLQGEKVGKVHLEPQGRYFKLHCECVMNSKDIYNLMVKSEEENLCLGTLLHDKGKQYLKRCLPMHGINETGEYYIEKQGKSSVLYISENEEFPHICLLERMRFVKLTGKTGVILQDPK